jgi:DNA-binding MurR/RpiR family transcriptional regulator
MTDILTKIETMMPEFSKGQKAIGRYMLEHYDKAAYLTASKLGAVVRVSESTVVRFAIELGFEGYPELQKSLQELIRTKLTSVQRMEITNDRIGDGEVLTKILSGDIEKILDEDPEIITATTRIEEHLFAEISLFVILCLIMIIRFFSRIIFDVINICLTYWI